MVEVYTNEELVEKLKNKATSHLQNHLPGVVAHKYLQVIESIRR